MNVSPGFLSGLGGPTAGANIPASAPAHASAPELSLARRVGLQRRGSASPKMLRPSIEAFKRHQLARLSDATHRISAPLPASGFPVQQSVTALSFSSAMDLMTMTTSRQQQSSNGNGNQSWPSQDLNHHRRMFQSSSHHAVAGDLLSMSRTSAGPTPLQLVPQPIELASRKRTIASKQAGTPDDDRRDHRLRRVTWDSQQGQDVDQDMGVHHQQAPLALPNASAEEEHDHHHHRTIRPCRRSDSFEMMD